MQLYFDDTQNKAICIFYDRFGHEALKKMIALVHAGHSLGEAMVLAKPRSAATRREDSGSESKMPPPHPRKPTQP